MLSGASLAFTPHQAYKAEHQSAQSILKKVLKHLHSHNPSSFGSYSAIIHHRFWIKDNFSQKADGLLTDTIQNADNKTNDIYIYSSETLSVEKRLKPNFKQ